jgi:exo-beta-1,3-glucanase (GH17 family)
MYFYFRKNDVLFYLYSTFHNIQALHPTKQIVLGESGWATSAITNNGDESLIIGEASETAQKVFYDAYRQW